MQEHGGGDQWDVLIQATHTHAHMHTTEREGEDQTLSNAFVSLSEDPQSGAEATGVNGCAAVL